MANLTVREFQSKFAAGAFDNNDFDTQVSAGWYDWFCSDRQLAGKTKRLGKVVSGISDGGKVDLDNHHVWFENNCPMAGPLYDDIRISDATGNLLVMSYQNKEESHTWTVYSYLNNFKEPIFECDDSRVLVKWLNRPWEGE